MKAQADWFIPLGRYFTLRNQLSGGHNVSENLFFNELFRIGGIRTLRGFDEQSIFATSYIIANTELRYLLQQNSNVLLFWNGAWYRNTVRMPSITDKPYGFGAGLNFETGAGIFALYYAVGSELGQSIQFENAKIHFGFTALF
jgi:hemolysin activation/secretion protein